MTGPDFDICRIITLVTLLSSILIIPNTIHYSFSQTASQANQTSTTNDSNKIIEKLNSIDERLNAVTKDIGKIKESLGLVRPTVEGTVAAAASFPSDVVIYGPAKSGRIPFSYIVRIMPQGTVLPNGTVSASATEIKAAVDAKNAAIASVNEKGIFQVTHIYNNTLGGTAFSIQCPSCSSSNLNTTIAAGVSDTLKNITNIPNSIISPDRVVTASQGQQVPPNIIRIGGNLSFAKSGYNTGNNVNASIAVIDTGIDCTHPDLNVVSGYDFITKQNKCFDDNGHGTHVSGIVAAKDNHEGVVGVAPGARLYALKVLDSKGSGKLSDILAALDWVVANAIKEKIDVVNMSLELPGNADELLVPLQNILAKKVIVVVAAGNDGDNARGYSPSMYGEKKFGPNRNQNLVITVSAIADSDGLCGGHGPFLWTGFDDSFPSIFSNFGEPVNFAAPGTDIFSTWKNNGYAKETGTSQAAPHVAGAVALYKSLHPTADLNEVEQALTNMAEKSTDKCPDNPPNKLQGEKGYIDVGTDMDVLHEPLLWIGGLK